MGIDAKTIQDFVKGVVRFTMDTGYRYVENHPFVFGVVLSFFLLYFLIPPVFYFIIYCFPVSFCIIVSIKIYFRTQNFEVQQNVKRVDDKSFVESKSIEADHHVVSGNNDKPKIQSRRRNFKLKDKEWDSESGKEEKSRGVSTATRTIDALIVENQKLVMEEKESSGHNAATAEKIQAQDDLMNETSLNEEKSKRIIDEKESSYLDHGESSSRNAFFGGDVQALDHCHPLLYSQPSMIDLIHDELVEQSENNGMGDGEVEDESSDDAEDEEDEEEAQQERNKAVEWTADDQQNLMDLGDSELERNKRLESLIARRRARKLFRMALEKRILDSGGSSQGQIAPISILRNSLLNVPNINDVLEGLPTPGSAPSVLLPSRNPFDIPYDPLEEKPNLMADSFHQEFSAAHEKDVLFPRQDSLLWGPSFSLESQQQQDKHDSKSGQEGLRFSKFRTFSDMSAHDQLIDNYLCQGQALFRMLSATDLVEVGSQTTKQSNKSDELKHEEDREPGNGMAGFKVETENFHDDESRSAYRSDAQRDTDSVRDHSSELCSLASDEASELSFQGNISASTEILELKVGKFPQKLSDRVQNSLTFLVPDSVAYNGNSYDSSPSANEKPRMENRFFFREKMPCHSPVYSIASDLQVEVSEVGSPPVPTDGAMSAADIESSYDGDVEKEMTSGSEEMWGASCHLSGVEENESRSREINDIREDDILPVGFSAIKQNLEVQIASSTIPEQVAEQDLSNTSILSSSRNETPEKEQAHSKNTHDIVSENVKQVVEEVQRFSKISDALPPKIPQKQFQSMKESASHQSCEVYSEKLEELSNPLQKSAAEVNVFCNVDDNLVHEKDAQLLTNNVASMDLSKPDEKINSESSKYIEDNYDKPDERQITMESEKRMQENENSTFLERDPGKLNEPEGDILKPIVGRDNLPSVEDSRDGQNITEAGVSGVNQSSRHPIMPALQPIVFVADQISSSSSSCSSPRSVLPGKIPREQIPSSHFDPQIHVNVQPPIVDGRVRNNSLDEEEPESITLTAQNSQHLEVKSLNHLSTSSNARESEEPSAEVVEGISELLNTPVAAVILSEHSHETLPGSVDHTEGKSQTLAKCKAGISSSKLEEKIANSNFPGTMMKEKETLNHSVNSSTEVNLIEDINDPAVNEKEHNEKLKSVKSNEDGSQLQKGKLTENEAIVASSNSIERNEGSNFINGSEDIIHHHPKQASFKDNLESLKDNQGESKNLMECEASAKPSISASETVIREVPSDPLPQKSAAEVGVMHHLMETVGHEMSNKKSFIDEVNVTDQTKPVKATAEGNIMHNMEEKDANKVGNKISLVNQENVADQTKPSEDAAQLHVMLSANEIVANEAGGMKSLNDQEHVAEQPKPVESPAEVDVMSKMGETVTTGMSNKKMLIDQENIVDKPKPAMATAEGDITHHVNERVATVLSNKKSLIDQEHVAEQSKPGKSSAEVDIMQNMSEAVADETSNKKSLMDQETFADLPKLDKNNDSLKAIEDINHEAKDLKIDNVQMNKLTNNENH